MAYKTGDCFLWQGDCFLWQKGGGLIVEVVGPVTSPKQTMKVIAILPHMMLPSGGVASTFKVGDGFVATSDRLYDFKDYSAVTGGGGVWAYEAQPQKAPSTSPSAPSSTTPPHPTPTSKEGAKEQRSCEPSCRCRGGGYFGHEGGCPMNGYYSKKSSAYFN